MSVVLNLCVAVMLWSFVSLICVTCGPRQKVHLTDTVQVAKIKTTVGMI